jgi:hypothetical protein
MVDAYGDPIVEGPYYCHRCDTGSSVVVDDDHPDVFVVYCRECDDIVQMSVISH